jgi:hypothetical protein
LATALSVISLARVPGAGDITAKAIRFLVAEMERSSIWRRWASKRSTHPHSPVDVDDTACASMAVSLGGIDTGANRNVLLAGRNESGVFMTQVAVRPPLPSSPAGWLAASREFASWLHRRRNPNQAGAETDEVDCVVNAHVVTYLGPEATTRAASAYLAELVARGREAGCDQRYPDVARLYYALSTAIRHGDRILALVADLIVARVERRLADDGDECGDLTTALLALTLDNLANRGEAYDKAVARVVAEQTAEGSWGRDVVCVDGPAPSAACVSEALTTATCLEVLAAADRNHNEPWRL